MLCYSNGRDNNNNDNNAVDRKSTAVIAQSTAQGYACSIC